jgi:hypothetical protein
MLRTIAIPLVLLMLVRPECRSQSLGENIAPVRYLQEIQKRQQKSAVRKAGLEKAKPTPCPLASAHQLRCVIGEDDLIEFLQPFPFPFDSAGRDVPRLVNGMRTTWAPEASVDQGKSVLKPILRSAKLRQPMSCDYEDCRIAVSVHGPNTQTLAICSALSLGKQLGPPKDCEVVAVRNRQQWWMEVIDQAWSQGHAMSPVYNLEIRGLPRSSILATLDKALSSAPLSLPNRTVKTDRVMAVAPKRFSRILSGGWFEWAQILVELDEEFQMQVSLDLLVNKQNTSDPADWHLPTYQQEDEYRKAIAETVTGALAAICIEPVWSGSDALRCTKLRTSDGAIVQIPEGAARGYGASKLDPRVTRK